MGDPAGVGREITAAAWRRLRATGPAFFVVGDPALYPGGRVCEDAAAARAAFAEALPVLPLALSAAATPGRADVVHAPAIAASIKTAVALAAGGAASAVVTNPIAKHVLHAAGFGFAGHTELIAALTADVAYEGARGPVMMVVGGGLRVALATIHLPLAQVPGAITEDGLVQAGLVTAQALRRDFGVGAPRLALCGLNPHAGEAGGLGREEIEIINPAAARLRALGVQAADAAAADSLFHAEARSGYDAVLAMYHDQGLIPVKTLDFHGGVNVTLGLPIVRTSPDHGAAFGIAGRGTARPDSLIAALRLAATIAARRAGR